MCSRPPPSNSIGLIRSFVDEARVGGFSKGSPNGRWTSSAGWLGWGFTSPLLRWSPDDLTDTGLPILYKQIRSGQGGRPFAIYKFRTMRQDAEQDGKVQLTQEKDDRITRSGNFLRRTHSTICRNSGTCCAAR